MLSEVTIIINMLLVNINIITKFTLIRDSPLP